MNVRTSVGAVGYKSGMRDRAEVIDEICELFDCFKASALTDEELLDFAILLRCFSHPARSAPRSLVGPPILRVVDGGAVNA